MSRKIKKKNIETQLHMRGNAEIEKWAEAALEIPDPEDLEVQDWESEPNTINGVPLRSYKSEKMTRERKICNEDTF